MRFSFKLRTIRPLDLQVNPYSGTKTKFPQTALGQGQDVVQGLMNEVPTHKHNHVVMHNFLIFIPLMNELLN